MPQEEERTPPTIEAQLANIVGNGHANPGYVASATELHRRIGPRGVVTNNQAETKPEDH